MPPFLQEYTAHTKSVNAVQWSPTGPGSLHPNANRYLARYIICLQKEKKRNVRCLFSVYTDLFLLNYDEKKTAVQMIKQLRSWTWANKRWCTNWKQRRNRLRWRVFLSHVMVNSSQQATRTVSLKYGTSMWVSFGVSLIPVWRTGLVITVVFHLQR